jgi:tight adherence protein B
LPIGLAIIVFLLNPEYLLGIMAWPWICMPIASFIMVVIGFFVMRKIAKIEV